MKQSSNKIGILRTLENEFAAAAMTEGNLEMAREFLRQTGCLTTGKAASPRLLRVRNFINGFEHHFAAAAMAEGGHEMAREYLQCSTLKKRHASLHTFLKTIGLENVRFQYRIAVV